MTRRRRDDERGGAHDAEAPAGDSGAIGAKTVTSDRSPVGGHESTIMGANKSSDPRRFGRDLPAAAHDATIASGSVADGRPKAIDEIRIPTVPRSHYHVIEEYGRGGLGRVLRARDKRTGRLVAIKETLTSTEQGRARFEREALFTASLQHPSIVPVYEVGRWPDGQPFYAMKFVEGMTLRDAIEAAPDLAARLELIEHVAAIAEALAYAHSHRIVHRDLKPTNILIGEFSETVVIDWGLAKNVSSGGPELVVELEPRPEGELAPGQQVVPELTRAGALMGTPAYMAPEQARGETLDARADVYALGAIVYHVVAGVPPYADTDSDSTLEAVLHGPPVPLSALDQAIPEDLCALAERAMARDADNRYPHARALASELHSYLSGDRVRAHRYSSFELARRFVRRHRNAVVVATVAALCLAVVGVMSVLRIADERDEAGRQSVAARSAQQKAETHHAALSENLAISELAKGEPGRALAYLRSAAEIRGELSATLRFLLGRSIRALSTTRPLGGVTSLVAARQSPDRRYLAFASAKGEIELWDIDGYKRILAPRVDSRVRDLHPLVGGSGVVVATSEATTLISTDGSRRRLAPGGWVVALDAERLWSGDSEGNILVTDLASGQRLESWKASDQPIGELRLSPNGRQLVSASGSGEAVVWDVESGRRVARLPNGEYLEWSPSGELLAVRNGDQTMVCAAADGRVLQQWSWPTGSSDLIFVGEEVLLSRSASGQARLLEIESGKIIAEIETLSTSSSSPAVFGDSMVIQPESGSLELRSAKDGSLRLRTHRISGESAIFYFNSVGEIVVVGWDGSLKAVDIGASGDRAFPRDAVTSRLAFNASETTIVTGSRDGSIVASATRGGHTLRKLRAEDEILWLEASRTSERFAAATERGEVLLIGEDGIERRFTGHALGVRQVFFVEDERALVSAGRDGIAIVWDLISARERCRIETGHSVPRVAVDSSRKMVASFGTNRVGLLWSTSDCSVLHRLSTEQKATVRTRISPSGRHLAAVGYSIAPGSSKTSASVAVFRTKDGDAVELDTALEMTAISLAFAPLGERLAVGTVAGELEIWDVDRRELVVRYPRLPGGVTDLAYSRDGSLLFAGNSTGELRVLEARQSRVVSVFDNHATGLYFLRAGSDGSFVGTAAHDHGVSIRQVAPWNGTVDDLSKLADCLTPWQAIGGQLESASIGNRAPSKPCLGLPR